MADFFKALGVSFAVLVALAGATWWLILRSLRRANQVAATRRSRAPLGWLWSWRMPARLHRRLRRVVQMACGAVDSVDHRQVDAAPA
ncbi:MAG: hypothetical protein M3N98_01635, partial [Actinomycetota bacterium]|nr:hypothetical protein [Actinomycetota bacterium]